MAQISSEDLLELVRSRDLELLAARVAQLAPYRWEVCHASVLYTMQHYQYAACQILATKIAISPHPPYQNNFLETPSEVIKTVLNRDLAYWSLLEPFLRPWIYNWIQGHLQSLELIRHFHEQELLTENIWKNLLLGEVDRETLLQRWAIRLSPSGVIGDYDRKWLQQQAITSITQIESPSDAMKMVPDEIGQLQTLHPEIIQDCLDQVMRAVWFPSNGKKIQDLIEWVHSEASKIDYREWLCQALPEIVVGFGSSQQLKALLAKITAPLPVRYYYDPKSNASFLISEYTLGRSVNGWTTFIAHGYYLYSTKICVSRDHTCFVHARMRGFVVPMSDDPVPIAASDPPVTIQFGPNYSVQTSIYLPAFLSEWHRVNSRAKSARSCPE